MEMNNVYTVYGLYATHTYNAIGFFFPQLLLLGDTMKRSDDKRNGRWLHHH